MIYIPKENVEILDMNKDLEGIFWSYNDDIVIHIIHNKKDDFYSYVNSITGFELLNCSEQACSAKPQLRYNKILKKYFCTCSSAMICTKNDDDAEIEHYKTECNLKLFDESTGFFDDPVLAIYNWQIMMAKDYEVIAQELLDEFKNK